MSRSIYTIGHSTRPFDEFLELLRSAEIDTLIDVRRFPGSRRHPQYNSENLSHTLPAHGIAYVHEPELGGRRRVTDDSRNAFWRNASFRAYADYMSTAEFAAALERVVQSAKSGRVAIMCAEAVPWRCHRQLIADALVARGETVRHILSETRVDTHELNPGAVVAANGTVDYPAAKTEQPTFFDSGAPEDGP